MSLMCHRSHSCAGAGRWCCSTHDGSMPPVGCRRMLPSGDTAAGKALFLGKGAISHGPQMGELGALGG